MKIKKIMPLFAAALLLVGCNSNSGVTTMKKPSFAKYSNSVSAEDFEKAAQEQLKATLDLVETEGEGDAKVIKGLKNGYTATTKIFGSQEFSGKNANGVSMSYVMKQYEEVTDKIDKASLRVNESTKEEEGLEMKNGYAYSNYSLVEKDGQKAILNAEPYYINMKGSSVGKGQNEHQFEYSQGKVKQINVNSKEYRAQDTPETFDFSRSMATNLIYGFQSSITSIMYSIPSYFEEADVKFYVDGKVLTVAGEKTIEGTISFTELTYKSKAVISYVGQVNLEKLTSAMSTELTLEQSTENGTLKLVEKSYRASTLNNKNVTVKAVDTAKFVDLDA